MFRFTKTTKLAALAFAALTLASTVPAAAGGWNGPGRGGWNGGPGPGWGRGGWGGPGYYYGPRRNNGGAVAAGVIGGLVVGGLAAAAANNYYNQPRCWIQPQTFYNRWGQPYTQNVQVCR